MNVLIIGAGASGLMTAARLEENNINYLLVEKTDKLGRKVLASGAGRANLSNLNLDDSFYKNASYFNYDKFSFQDYLKANNFLTVSDNEGRVYPFSNSSQSLLNFLVDKIDMNKVLFNTEVTNLEITKDNKIKFNNNLFDKLVISCGNISSILDSDNYKSLFNNLDIKLSPLNPSLVGFKVKNINKRLDGIRVKVLANLIKNNKIINSEEGELIFKKNGISGIVIMNMSFYYNKLNDKSNTYLNIKLYPRLDTDMIRDYYNNKTLKYIINPKLYSIIENYSLDEIIKFLTEFNIYNLETYDNTLAQVISGGVLISEMNRDFSLRKNKNIYVIGEALDVDGVCGGYNLNFAFSSALEVSKNIIGE